MARCDHSRGNIQQFTEVCLDCGRNIYESDEEYEQHLREEIRSLNKELGKERIAKLQEERDRLLAEVRKKKDDNNQGGW